MPGQSSGSDLIEDYRAYLARFDSLDGARAEIGSFVKHNGQLIKKLRYDEFEAKYGEFLDVKQAYEDCLVRGDTINDLVVRILRERAAELLVDSPA